MSELANDVDFQLSLLAGASVPLRQNWHDSECMQDAQMRRWPVLADE